jgi:hypothetical protein
MSRSAYPAEAALLLPTLRGLVRLAWADQMTPAGLEIAWHQKRVDLVVASSGTGVLAVELKVSKWRRAIDQAYVNRWAATSSWVALWHACITAKTYRYAQQAGVGVLAVTANTVYPVVRAESAATEHLAQSLAAGVEQGGRNIRDLLGQAREEAYALA